MENIISAVLLLRKGCIEDEGWDKEDDFLSSSGTARERLVVKIKGKNTTFHQNQQQEVGRLFGSQHQSQLYLHL